MVESWICAGLMTLAIWMIGRAIIIEKTADINEMGFALVMGGMGMVILAGCILWVVWRMVSGFQETMVL